MGNSTSQCCKNSSNSILGEKKIDKLSKSTDCSSHHQEEKVTTAAVNSQDERPKLLSQEKSKVWVPKISSDKVVATIPSNSSISQTGTTSTQDQFLVDIQICKDTVQAQPNIAFIDHQITIETKQFQLLALQRLRLLQRTMIVLLSKTQSR